MKTIKLLLAVTCLFSALWTSIIFAAEKTPIIINNDTDFYVELGIANYNKTPVEFTKNRVHPREHGALVGYFVEQEEGKEVDISFYMTIGPEARRADNTALSNFRTYNGWRDNTISNAWLTINGKKLALKTITSKSLEISILPDDNKK